MVITKDKNTSKGLPCAMLSPSVSAVGSNIDGVTMEIRCIKTDAAKPEISYFIPHSLPICQNLVPTLPIMQLKELLLFVTLVFNATLKIKS